MINDIPIVKVGLHIKLVRFLGVCLGKYLERYFSNPMPFFVLKIADF